MDIPQVNHVDGKEQRGSGEKCTSARCQLMIDVDESSPKSRGLQVGTAERDLWIFATSLNDAPGRCQAVFPTDNHPVALRVEFSPSTSGGG